MCVSQSCKGGGQIIAIVVRVMGLDALSANPGAWKQSRVGKLRQTSLTSLLAFEVGRSLDHIA